MNVSFIHMNDFSMRGLLSGRKTQTRRLVKCQPPDNAGRIIGPEWYEPVVIDRHGMEDAGKPIFGAYHEDGEWGEKAPYNPGDLLWVRECWGAGSRPCPWEGSVEGLEYRADDYGLDDADMLPLHQVEPPEDVELDAFMGKWRPSIHMPRWASRMTLRVTNVRCDWLHNISDDDAMAEGIPFEGDSPGPADNFSVVWEDIHGKGSWADNPLLWIYEFEVIHKNVDVLLAHHEAYRL